MSDFNTYSAAELLAALHNQIQDVADSTGGGTELFYLDEVNHVSSAVTVADGSPAFIYKSETDYVGTPFNIEVRLTDTGLKIIYNDTTYAVLDANSLVQDWDSTSTILAPSANVIRQLKALVDQVAESRQNMGSFDTFAALNAAYTPGVMKAGAYAYVRNAGDDSRDLAPVVTPTMTKAGETWRYDQGLDPTDGTTFIWAPTIRLDETPRNFTAEPIQTDEIGDQQVTEDKLSAALASKVNAGSDHSALTNNPHGTSFGNLAGEYTDNVALAAAMAAKVSTAYLNSILGDPSELIAQLTAEGYLT